MDRNVNSQWVSGLYDTATKMETHCDTDCRAETLIPFTVHNMDYIAHYIVEGCKCTTTSE